MFNKEEYWLRRTQGLRGQTPVTAPTLIKTSGAQLFKVGEEEVYVPRRQRRALMRKFKADLTKGRIDLKKLNEKRIEINRDRNK